MKPQENEENSRTNRPTSASEDSIADNLGRGLEDRADAPDKDDLVEQVDVPDTKDCEWDEITDKFSKARDNSQAKNEYLTITSATTTAAIDPTHYQCAKFFEFKNREWVDRGIGHC